MEVSVSVEMTWYHEFEGFLELYDAESDLCVEFRFTLRRPLDEDALLAVYAGSKLWFVCKGGISTTPVSGKMLLDTEQAFVYLAIYHTANHAVRVLYNADRLLQYLTEHGAFEDQSRIYEYTADSMYEFPEVKHPGVMLKALHSIVEANS